MKKFLLLLAVTLFNVGCATQSAPLRVFTAPPAVRSTNVFVYDQQVWAGATTPPPVPVEDWPGGVNDFARSQAAAPQPAPVAAPQPAAVVSPPVSYYQPAYYPTYGYYGGQEWTVPYGYGYGTGVGFGYGRGFSRFDETGGTWSFLGLGGFAGFSVNSYPYYGVREVRVYQGPTTTAHFEAGGRSGGGGHRRRGH